MIADRNESNGPNFVGTSKVSLSLMTRGRVDKLALLLPVTHSVQ